MRESSGSDTHLRQRRGGGKILTQKVAVGDKDYCVLSPVIVDFARRMISFGIEREILGTDGRKYLIAERVVMHDGVEPRERQLPNGKTATYMVPVSRFSEIWQGLKEPLLMVLKECIQKHEELQAAESSLELSPKTRILQGE